MEKENCKHGRSIVLEKENCFELGFEGVWRGILSERKREVIPYRLTEDGKVREPTVELSLARRIWRLRASEAKRIVREGV